MNIIQSYITNNECYKTGAKLNVKGLMLHSVGCSQPNASVFVKLYNVPKPNGAYVAVQAFIDANTGDVYQTLPWGMRAWHCGVAYSGGPSANDTHIGIEMCEPNTITYTSGSGWVDNNPAKTKEMITRTYNSAVELFAKLCKQFNLNPLEDGVIISHSEGNKRKIASNHGDVEHIWNKFGLTMNQFRKDVNSKMLSSSNTSTTTESTSTSKPTSSTIYRVQVGAYTVKSNADDTVSKLKKAGFDAIILKSNNVYRVQVGAYTVKSNADDTVSKLKKAGFDDVFITTSTSTSTTTKNTSIKVGSKVKVKKGAKTYNGGNLADFVYDRVHIVKEISKDRVVITYSGVVIAAVKLSDLILL